ncbi:DUF2252 family protein [Pontibacterium sp.]|uniref:DUF2252 family protein n=1 Tax=Pontibacterium sp. TaxID=2036026 RepID=UPI0035696A07
MKVLHTRAVQVREQIERFNAGLPETDLALKFEKMVQSPFIFFRGSSHLYWHDVSRDWRISLFGGRPESQIWLQGDAHIYNFGALHDHQNRIYFGMDDFDDAVVADFQFDLWRLAASMVLDLQERDFCNDQLVDKAVKKLGTTYLHTVADAGPECPAVRMETAPKPIRKFLQKVHEKNTRQQMLSKWTAGDFRHFDYQHEKLETVDDALFLAIKSAVDVYHQTRIPVPEEIPRVLDIARRTQAGTGSLGNYRYYVLMEGRSADEHVILDIKQQREPASVAVMPRSEQHWYRETFTHEGRRHADAYRAIAEHPDSWLGWLSIHDQLYSVRERSPFKKDYPAHKLDADEYLVMASIWGEVLGREHARGSFCVQEPETSFVEFVRDQLIPEKKAFVRLLRAVAPHYARCVQQDWHVFRDMQE